MASIQRRRGRLQLRLDERERDALLDIVDTLASRDGAVASAPRAYEDDSDQAEYDRWVRPDIESGHEADIELIREGLGSGDDLLVLTEANAYAWLRGFNVLRRTAGATLGIEHDGWEVDADDTTKARPEYGMLIALGWLQEEMVAALET